MNYYYNNVPGKGLCRNNLIYTSLIDTTETVFCQWYHNDTDYHKGQNEIVDPSVMEEKWTREVKFLRLMEKEYPDLIPKILKIDHYEKKIFLEVEGVDFWQRSLDQNCNYETILPDWESQMLTIIRAHRDLGLFKYSMHPSSYFIVNGKLKSINYFFTYDLLDTPISIQDVESHIYSTRQEELKKHISKLGIEWNKPQSFKLLQELCFESFRKNYPDQFIDKAKEIYND